MPQNFLACDRDQALLLPPSLRDWLPEDHLAWLVLEAVEELDLSVFYGAYREDGHGRAAFEPAMMVALLVYAYAIGVRSSRAIERHWWEDLAFRVITANQARDHATIARFRRGTRWRSASCSARCWHCARRRAWCGSEWSPSTAPRSRPTPRITRRAATNRSPARSSKKPPSWTPPRTPCTGTRAVMSCRSTSGSRAIDAS